MTTKELSREIYMGRINKVFDYIDRHIDQPLFLNDLASEAAFSPFHFHRIFTFFTGETVNEFIVRVRVEKSASMLIGNPKLSILEIALQCGFNSASVFSRTFKKRFKVTPKSFRKHYFKNSKNSQLNSNIGKTDLLSPPYFSPEQQKKWRLIMKKDIQIKELPKLRVAYCRHTGAFEQIGTAYEKLFRWAGPRGLVQFPKTKTLTVYHDDPTVTAIEKVRQSACITIDEPVKPEGEIGTMEVPAGKYAVGGFEITEEGFQDAWDSMCNWLTDSGYQPDEGFPYELYHNNHKEHPEHKFILDICIPVKPL